jgi:FG-GAP-like repeat
VVPVRALQVKFVEEPESRFEDDPERPLPMSYVVAADMDGDHTVDLVGIEAPLANGKAGHPTYTLLNTDNDGVFVSNYAFSYNPGSEGGIAIADLDGDGDMDMIRCNGYHDAVIIKINLGMQSGQFVHDTYNAFNPASSGSWEGMADVSAVDLDNDGDLDLVFNWQREYRLGIIRNDGFALGNGKFNESAWVYMPILGQYDSQGACCRRKFTIADFNLDGYADILLGMKDQVMLYTNTFEVTGSLSFSSSILPLSGSDGVLDVKAADIDNDGYVDIVARSVSRVFWLKNQGGSISQTALLISTDSPRQTRSTTHSFKTTNWHEGVHAADFNADGLIDVMVETFYSGTDFRVAVFMQDSTAPGTFASVENVFQTSANLFTAIPCDYNGDGMPDILVSTSSGLIRLRNSLSLLDFEDVNQGQIVTNKFSLGSLTPRQQVRMADVDSDSRQDMIVGYNHGGKAHWSWFRNEPSGGFGVEQPIFSTDEGADAVLVAAGRFSNGTATEVVIGSNNGVLRYFKNDGTGSFTMFQTLTLPPIVSHMRYYASLYAADINSDGQVDIVLLPWHTDRAYYLPELGPFPACIMWLSFDHNLNMLTEHCAPTPHVPWVLADGWPFGSFGDLNGDGHLDMFTSSAYQQSCWLENVYRNATYVEFRVRNIGGWWYNSQLNGDGRLGW